MIENLGDKANSNGFDRRPEDARKGGRPKKLLTRYAEHGYSKSQVRESYSVIADLTRTQVQEILDNSDSTVLELAAAKAFLNAADKGDYKQIKEIIELFADKPSQGIELSTPDDNKHIPFEAWKDKLFQD